LADTYEHSTRDENGDLTTRGKCLHEGGNDDSDCPYCHADSTTSPIGKGSSHEESRYNGTDCVRCVDGSDYVGAGMVVIGDPVLRILKGVEDRRIIAVEYHA